MADDQYTQFRDMRSYWDIPDMKAGMVTGKVAFDLLKYCKAKDLDLLALADCTGSTSCGELLGAAAKLEIPACIQFSVGVLLFLLARAWPTTRASTRPPYWAPATVRTTCATWPRPTASR